MRTLKTMAASLTAGMALAACAAPQTFSLPDGDAVAGQRVFVDSQCSFCHPVSGVEGIPAPIAEPPVPVVFGSGLKLSDAEIVDSIVDPSHTVSTTFPEDAVKMGDESRMPAYRHTLSLQQLIDLVAFLRSVD